MELDPLLQKRIIQKLLALLGRAESNSGLVETAVHEISELLIPAAAAGESVEIGSEEVLLILGICDRASRSSKQIEDADRIEQSAQKAFWAASGGQLAQYKAYGGARDFQPALWRTGLMANPEEFGRHYLRVIRFDIEHWEMEFSSDLEPVSLPIPRTNTPADSLTRVALQFGFHETKKEWERARGQLRSAKDRILEEGLLLDEFPDLSEETFPIPDSRLNPYA